MVPATIDVHVYRTAEWLEGDTAIESYQTFSTQAFAVNQA